MSQHLGSPADQVSRKIVQWADVQAAAEAAVGPATVAKLPHGEWAAAVEILICAQAGAFEGSWGSTFSGFIHRLRALDCTCLANALWFGSHTVCCSAHVGQVATCRSCPTNAFCTTIPFTTTRVT